MFIIVVIIFGPDKLRRALQQEEDMVIRDKEEVFLSEDMETVRIYSP